MKKIILLLAIMIFAMCGCANVVEEYPIDARYTESYKGIDTTYEMKWNGETWSEMPNTHTKAFPEKMKSNTGLITMTEAPKQSGEK